MADGSKCIDARRATCSWSGKNRHFSREAVPEFEGTINTELPRKPGSDRLHQAFTLTGTLRFAGESIFEGVYEAPDAHGPETNMDMRGTLQIGALGSNQVTGVWRDRKLLEGTGTLTLENRTCYSGFFGPSGVLHGEGRLTWPNGAIYDGHFDQGYIDGQGTLRWPDGTVLEGAFYRTPTWQVGAGYSVCDVAFGNGNGARFNFSTKGEPESKNLIYSGRP